MVLFLFFLSQTKNFLFSTGCQWTHVSPFLTVVFVGFLFNLVFPSDFDFLAFKSFLFSFAGFLFGFFLFYPSSKFESEDILSFGKDSLTVTRKLGFLLPEIFGGRFSSQRIHQNVVFGWKWLLFGDNWGGLSLFLFHDSFRGFGFWWMVISRSISLFFQHSFWCGSNELNSTSDQCFVAIRIEINSEFGL